MILHPRIGKSYLKLNLIHNRTCLFGNLLDVRFPLEKSNIGMDINGDCLFCDSHVKDILHLFINVRLLECVYTENRSVT